jgi:hypothetical protein
MRKQVLAVVAVLAVAVLTTSVALARPHAAGHHRGHGGLTIHVTIPASSQLTNPALTGAEPPAGVLLIVGGTGTFTGHGDGQVHYQVTVTNEAGGIVNAVLQFKNGTITLNGITTEETGDPESYAITGGTGKYRGARGEITQSNDTSTDTQETFDLTFDFGSKRH